MGELKGQILGILLVLMIFSGLAVAYNAIFQSAQEVITERMDSVFENETQP